MRQLLGKENRIHPFAKNAKSRLSCPHQLANQGAEREEIG
jgi:hypothetical protein